MTQIDSKTDLGLPSRFDCTDMMGMRTTKREIQIMDNICVQIGAPSFRSASRMGSTCFGVATCPGGVAMVTSRAGKQKRLGTSGSRVTNDG